MLRKVQIIFCVLIVILGILGGIANIAKGEAYTGYLCFMNVILFCIASASLLGYIEIKPGKNLKS